MALVLADRVKETTTTTGTGTYTLAGAVTGFESFGSIGNTNTTYYCCTDGTDFEVGIGTYASSGTTLARTTILQSSNSDNAVNWTSGTRTIFCTIPAEKLVFEDASGNISIPGTIDGRDLATDGTKLDGIESNATADQTAAEIRTLVESATDSNVFTDADHSKLNGIEASATADQTAAEIRTLVESATDSNVFTDADHTKLNGIESNATADQTASEILTAIKTVDGSGSGLDADTLDGSHASTFATQSNVETYINRSYVDKDSASNLAVGWYTIAQNTGDRAVARFALWDVNSGDHQSVIFYAAHHYGTDASNTITVLHNSNFSGSPFRYLRIKDGATYEGAALQVYIDDGDNEVNVAIVGDDVQSSGWERVDFLADASAPSLVSNWSGFTEKAKIDLDLIAQGGMATTGPIYADGNTSQYKVLTTNDEGSGNGIDADTVDGSHASAFATAAQGVKADSALQNVVEDTTPQLGGNLDLNSNDITGTGDINITGTLQTSSNAIIGGNLTVSGTTTTVNTETINLADNNIVLNSNHTGTPTQNAGITIERGTSTDKVFQWNESGDYWETDDDLNVTGSVTLDNFASIAGVDPGNPSPSSDELRASGYGIIGNRGTVYLTNANSSGAIQLGIGGIHNAGPKMTILSNGNVGIADTSPSEKLDVTGNIAVTGTVDGRDVAADGTKLDGIEASADVTDTANVTSAGALMDSEVTNLAQVKAFDSSDYATAAQGTTADAALPTAGGTMTGNLVLGDGIETRFGDGTDLVIKHVGGGSSSINNNSGTLQLNQFANDSDVVINSDNGSGSTANYFRADGSTGDAILYHYGTEKIKTQSGGVDVSGNITVSGTVDGRDLATDGTKLDGIEASATADQTAAEIRTLVESATDSNVFTDADHSKLNGIEASADVTDATNVTAAGALMDSEVTNLAQVKAFDSSDYATSAQGTTADAALPKAGGTMTGALNLNDSTNINIGAGNDLQLYHNGSASYIDNNTSHLYIRNNVDGDDGGNIYLQAKSGENGIIINDDGAVQLYYNGSQKVQVHSTYTYFYNHLYANSYDLYINDVFFNGSIDGSDNDQIKLGTSDDFLLYHDGTDNIIEPTNGQLVVAKTGTGSTELQIGGIASTGGSATLTLTPVNGYGSAVVNAAGSSSSLILQQNGTTKATVSSSALTLDTGVDLIFEGATADANETTVTVADPTADRTITLPDATGTVMLNTNLNFPFFQADGSSDTIALTADLLLPFTEADGSTNNIALTT